MRTVRTVPPDLLARVGGMTGDEAVSRVFAAILADRYPGTVWLEVQRRDRDAHAGAGKTIRRLAPLEYADAVGSSRGAPVDGGALDEDHVEPGVSSIRRSATDSSCHVAAASGRRSRPTACARARCSAVRPSSTRARRSRAPAANGVGADVVDADRREVLRQLPLGAAQRRCASTRSPSAACAARSTSL